MDARPNAQCALFVGGRTFAFAGARLKLLEHFVASGWRTAVAARADETAARLEASSIEVYDVPFAAHTISPRADLRARRMLRSAIAELKPSLVHLHHAKPTVLAAGLARKSGATVFSTVTGLGAMSDRRGIVAATASFARRRALRDCDLVVFQNPDDRDACITQRATHASKSALIIGAGVDTNQFRPQERINETATRNVLMPARLLWQKGIREFVEAARICKRQHTSVRFLLAGEWPQSHPDAVSSSWLGRQLRFGAVEYLGYERALHELLSSIDLVVLPSYREGAPRVLMEAAACGIPAVTVDTPGCRETVVHEHTGLIAPPRDASALAQCILELLNDEGRRRAMSINARRLAVQGFDQRVIAGAFVRLYRELGLSIAEYETLDEVRPLGAA